MKLLAIMTTIALVTVTSAVSMKLVKGMIGEASYPGSSQFFNDAFRETGKIHHVSDVRWKGLGAARTYTFVFYWEKHNGKIAELSKLESPGTNMLARQEM